MNTADKTTEVKMNWRNSSTNEETRWSATDSETNVWVATVRKDMGKWTTTVGGKFASFPSLRDAKTWVAEMAAAR